MLGYWAGLKFGDLEELRKKIQHYEHRVIIGAIVVVSAFVLYHWIRKKMGGVPVVDKAMRTAVKQVEKKDRNVNEPLQFYVANSLYELVVNKVDKDAVTGYVSSPKYSARNN